MSDIAATTVHEAYAFACMGCGYGWEQAYEIEHHVDGSGNPFVVYKADGERVPSPLSTLTCANCGGHVVRIMQAGQVSSAQQLLQRMKTARPRESTAERSARSATERAAAGGSAPAAVLAAGHSEHHWRPSDLLRPFRR